MFNLTNSFNGMFGKIAPGMCRLTMNGEIAVATNNNGSKVYKTYNIKKKTLTNVTNFCFNIGDEMFFVIPTNKVEIGDIILVQGKPKCVIGVDSTKIEVIDYESSEIKQVVPERHIFMGNVYFYGRIISKSFTFLERITEHRNNFAIEINVSHKNMTFRNYLFNFTTFIVNNFNFC